MIKKGFLIVVALIIILAGLLVGTFFIVNEAVPTEYKEITEDVTYKYIGGTLFGEPVYKIYHSDGFIYVCEAQFYEIEVPQKITDGLFLLPDGTYR